jgi:hypothetical protein
MKRAAVVIAVVFAAVVVLSSCNKQTCPAYSQIDEEQTEQTT